MIWVAVRGRCELLHLQLPSRYLEGLCWNCLVFWVLYNPTATTLPIAPVSSEEKQPQGMIQPRYLKVCMVSFGWCAVLSLHLAYLELWPKNSTVMRLVESWHSHMPSWKWCVYLDKIIGHIKDGLPRQNAFTAVTALQLCTIEKATQSHLTNQHLIDKHAETPPVDSSGVWSVCQYLWSQKLRSPTECTGPVPVTHASGRGRRKTEIGFEGKSEDCWLWTCWASSTLQLTKLSTVRNPMSFNVRKLTFFTEPKVCYLHKTICI